MALIDKASLLMVPSTYEAGTLYNVLPSGNRAPDKTGENSGYDQTRADFTFDRGTNAAATRVNSDGLIEKYRENLLTESNNFSDSDWTKTSASVTSGQSGYDGTNNAWKLQATSTGTFRRVVQSTAVNKVVTNSVYAKAGNVDFLGVTATNGSSSDVVYFNLSTGVVSSSTGSNIIDSNIEAVSGAEGWYRCSVTSTANSSGYSLYFVSDAGGSSATNGNYILIQNAQQESGLVSTDYLDSGATTAKAGVLIDLPRINYDANGENGSLLLEPQRSNLITQSEYFGLWSKNGVSVEQNQIVSPNGNLDAAQYQGDGTNSPKMLYVSAGSVTSGTTYTWSVFVKRGTLNFCQLLIGSANFDAALFSNFDLLNGTIGSSGGGAIPFIESYGNDWYRVGITATANANGTATPFVVLANSATMGRVNGFTTSDYIYIYGAQFEQGSYPTSYIPNHGTSGGVTRAAENSTEAVDVENVPTGYPFAIYAEPYLTEGVGNGAFGFYNNSNQYSYYSLQITSQGKFNMLSRPQGVTQNEALSSSTFDQGFHKVVCLFESSTTIKLYVNGSLEATKSNCTNNGFNSAFNDYVLGVFRSLETKPCSIKKFIVFNEGLTNQECIDITA